mgnify:CR=1 FL=1
MSALTLPGTIRPCSPVIVTRGTYAGLRGVVVSIADGLAMVAFGKPSISSLIALGLDDLALDLTGPTGRAHAAWLVVANCDPSDLLDNDSRAVFAALSGEDMKPEDIERLRLVCLHVAGLPS